MREVHYYVADDGTKFGDEYECKMHELAVNVKSFENRIKFYGNDVDDPISLEDVQRWGDVCCIVVKDETILEELNEILLIDDDVPDIIYQPWCYEGQKTGVWVYRWDTEGWVNLNRQLEALQDSLNYWMEKE